MSTTSYTMENESNKVQPEQVARPILQHQYVPSFDTTPLGALDTSVDCDTEEILVHELEPSFVTKIGEDFDISDYVDPSDSGKTHILDNSNFGIEDSYEHAQLSPKLQRIHHEKEPQVEDATIDIDNRLRTGDDINGILDLTNRIQVVQIAEYLTTLCSTRSSLPRNDVVESLVYSQDVRRETSESECHDILNRKNLEENDDVGGRNNTENSESVITQDGCENESIQSSEIQSKRNVVHPLFKIRHKVQRRKRIHSDAKPHLCKVCDKSFKQKSHLLSHSTIHAVERPYVCETCNRSFRRKDDLKNHSNVHKDGRPYTCSICEQSFRRQRYLTQHYIVHTDEKPHFCGICDKSFRRKWDLVRHSYIHTGVKPYVCNVCQKGFTQRSQLFEHSDIHTGKSPHQCKVCGKSFMLRSNLRRHSKLHSDKKLD